MYCAYLVNLLMVLGVILAEGKGGSMHHTENTIYFHCSENPTPEANHPKQSPPKVDLCSLFQTILSQENENKSVIKIPYIGFTKSSAPVADLILLQRHETKIVAQLDWHSNNEHYMGSPTGTAVAGGVLTTGQLRRFLSNLLRENPCPSCPTD